MTSLSGGLEQALLPSGADGHAGSQDVEQAGEVFSDAAVAKDGHRGIPQGAVGQLHGRHEGGLGGDVGVAELEDGIFIVVHHPPPLGKALGELSAEQGQGGIPIHQPRDLLQGNDAGGVAGAVYGFPVAGGGQGEDDRRCALHGLLEGSAHAQAIIGIAGGEAVVAAAKQAYGMILLGQALGQVAHTPIAPDNGEAMSGQGGCRYVGHSFTPFGGIVTGYRRRSKAVTLQGMRR